MSEKKHVAKSGARAGQWVTCTAKANCRNGGTHISSHTLNDARNWLSNAGTKKSLAQITEEDVAAYQKDFLQAGTRKASDNPVVTPVSKKSSLPSNGLVRDQKVEDNAKQTLKSLSNPVRLKTKAFEDFLISARRSGVKVSFNAEKSRSGFFGLRGEHIVTVSQLALKGPVDQVDLAIKDLKTRVQIG